MERKSCIISDAFKLENQEVAFCGIINYKFKHTKENVENMKKSRRVNMSIIFYLEDDEDISQIVQSYLERRGFRVFLYKTALEAVEALQIQMPGILLLDWNLPDRGGDQLCRWVRSKWPKLPVIFLTVRGDTRDIVSGFQYGADDYVVKPFELEVLYSRICALLRRTEQDSDRILSCGSIALDRDRMMVFCEGEETCLSPAEYRLLLLLLENKGRTVTRQSLLEEIWDSNGNYVNDNTLTVTMKRLREKLKHPASIKTIRSFGYRMEDTI